MSSVTTAERAETRALSDRLLAALPLTSVYVWLCTVYLVEAWGRLTPWLFDDELKATQIARGIAASGRPMQRGQHVGFDSLYEYVTAPVWLIHDVANAYSGVKYLDVFLMAAVVFPTYFLARMIVGRTAALFAAAGAGAIPSLAYSGYLVEENVAYPYAALCFFLIAKALVEWPRNRRWAVGAGVACVVAPAVRGELAVLPAMYVLAVLFLAWTSTWARERRKDWTGGDWAGFVALLFGAIFLVSAVLTSASHSWAWATQFYKHRMIDQTGWAAGALAIGIGVIPLIAGLASLFRLPGEAPSRRLRAFRIVLVSALITFGLYTAVKAAYLSAVFATRVEERNLIYISPLLFIGTALLLDRRTVNRWALLGCGAFGAYLVLYAVYHPTQYPYEMNVQLYSDALGLAILQQANRTAPFYWTPQDARWVLLGIVVVGTLVIALLPVVRQRAARVAGALAVALGVAVVTWSLTGEIAAASGGNRTGQLFANTLSPTGQPYSWVDQTTHGAPTLYEGEGEYDQDPEWLVEFWNRSIVSVGSLDGTVGGPGPAGAPNVLPNGKLYWGLDPKVQTPSYGYAVEDWPCVDFEGATAARHWRLAGGTPHLWKLIRLTQPNRLRSTCSGIYPDGWTGSNDSEYFRFGQGQGWLRVAIARPAPGNAAPTNVHVLLGSLVNGPDREPVYGRTLVEKSVHLKSGDATTVWIRSPLQRFAARVVVDVKFEPHLVVPPSDPSYGDVRQLGVQLHYAVVRKAAHR
ncbi:MAG: hypothetical protein JO073_06150 [Actinobacteria bacterium]|nr:hypothetical protein [Actinomycetota bacterium]